MLEVVALMPQPALKETFSPAEVPFLIKEPQTTQTGEEVDPNSLKITQLLNYSTITMETLKSKYISKNFNDFLCDLQIEAEATSRVKPDVARITLIQVVGGENWFSYSGKNYTPFLRIGNIEESQNGSTKFIPQIIFDAPSTRAIIEHFGSSALSNLTFDCDPNRNKPRVVTIPSFQEVYSNERPGFPIKPTGPFGEEGVKASVGSSNANKANRETGDQVLEKNDQLRAAFKLIKDQQWAPKDLSLELLDNVDLWNVANGDLPSSVESTLNVVSALVKGEGMIDPENSNATEAELATFKEIIEKIKNNEELTTEELQSLLTIGPKIGITYSKEPLRQ